MCRRATRYLLAAALAAACHAPGAQDAAPAAVVQQLAPQLLAFAGSQQNFQNLVNGLAQGTPVQLTTILPNGVTQVVSFNPAGTLTPTQIAQVLESARQQLIGLGLANPTGEQIATALAPANPVNAQFIPSAAPPARVNTSDSLIPSGATSRSPILGNVSSTPTPPGVTPTPAPAQPAPMTRPATVSGPRQLR